MPGQFVYRKRLVSSSSASAEIPARAAITHPFLVTFVTIKVAISSIFFLGRFERKFIDRYSAFGASESQSGNVKHLPLRSVIILISHLNKFTCLSSCPAVICRGIMGDLLRCRIQIITTFSTYNHRMSILAYRRQKVNQPLRPKRLYLSQK